MGKVKTAAFMTGLVALALWLAGAWGIAFVAVLAISIAVGTDWIHQPARIGAERQQQSICTFARSLGVRKIDPWVIRAVYEELTDLCGFPVKVDDDFNRDLAVDEEDLEYAVVDIAARAGRSLEQPDYNPYYTPFATVRDLINFLNRQPADAAIPCE